jgi:hypothetical protein
MTRDEILALTAGREADAVAHRTVFNEEPIPSTGWITGEYSVRDSDGLCWMPHYTTCRNAAAMVLAEVERRDFWWELIEVLREQAAGGKCIAAQTECWRILNAIPLQLCQAALLALTEGGAK